MAIGAEHTRMSSQITRAGAFEEITKDESFAGAITVSAWIFFFFNFTAEQCGSA
ncbi:hypothetical protein ARMSODRAFT_957689 [Armillaria solidipes]|uniref:Uncharacterized protein n=1 Tax=Armillaria solidipes TaxID=1076256 RepID=A0A2H3BI95_9AGAR|nr:hypothetical protein ARMSODRAFT_957689 [Armillaria solidipes]